MCIKFFIPGWILSFTTSRGHCLGMLSDGGLLSLRRAMQSLIPAGSYDDDLPEPPLPSEKPLREPIDVPVREPFDVPVRSPSDVPVQEPYDVPPPPAEPPFPRPPQPTSPPERKPQAGLKDWLDGLTGRRDRGRTEPR